MMSDGGGILLRRDLVLRRARVDSLEKVRSLNLWGCKLSNVELLRSLPSLQVLNLSCNELTSLESLANCTKLKDLYLRQNRLGDLRQLQHLQPLASLQSLWVENNPLSRVSGYRRKVVQLLPQLKYLDNKAVSEEERQQPLVQEEQQEKPMPSSASSTTSSNVLKAVLCLLGELDHSSLTELQKEVAKLLD